MYSYGSPHMAAQKQGDQLKRTFSSCVRIQDVVLKTYLGRWTIGRSGERGSGISVLPARYDDDDEHWYFVWARPIIIFTAHSHQFNWKKSRKKKTRSDAKCVFQKASLQCPLLSRVVVSVNALSLGPKNFLNIWILDINLTQINHKLFVSRIIIWSYNCLLKWPDCTLQRGKTPPTSILDMTLNNLTVRLQ